MSTGSCNGVGGSIESNYMRQKGFIQILPIIIVLCIAVVVFIYAIKKPHTLNSESVVYPTSDLVVVTATPEPTPGPSPTVVPVPTQIPVVSTPIVIPTPTPTLKPTQKPITGPPGAGYTNGVVHTEKGDFSATILTVDLNTARMVTDTGNDGDCGNNCTVMSLQNYVNRNGGFAGVNGSYFCPASYAECSSKSNSFDFPDLTNLSLGSFQSFGGPN